MWRISSVTQSAKACRGGSELVDGSVPFKQLMLSLAPSTLPLEETNHSTLGIVLASYSVML